MRVQSQPQLRSDCDRTLFTQHTEIFILHLFHNGGLAAITSRFVGVFTALICRRTLAIIVDGF